MLVVDTNILFSFFKKESFTRTAIISASEELTSPAHSLEELEKHSETIRAKSNLTDEKLDEALSLLKEYVKFVPLDEYSKHLPEAISLASAFSSKDKDEFMDDVDFFALALKEKCSIWSNDKLFKKQVKVKVVTTAELLEELKDL